MKPPRRPKTALRMFRKEELDKRMAIDDNWSLKENREVFNREVRSTWAIMPDSEKMVYKRLARRARIKYRKDVDKLTLGDPEFDMPLT